MLKHFKIFQYQITLYKKSYHSILGSGLYAVLIKKNTILPLWESHYKDKTVIRYDSLMTVSSL